MVGLWGFLVLVWFVQCVQAARLLWLHKTLRANAYVAGELRGVVSALSVTAIVFLVATIYMVVVGF